MNERWLPAVGWEDLYEVSDLGRVRSVTRLGTTQFGVRSYGGSVVAAIRCANGYLAVNLTGRGLRKQCLVHKLVLEAFAGARQHGMQACHNDGNRANPRLTNLRWDTTRGNHADKHKHGTAQIGVRNPRARLTEDAVREIRAGLSTKDAAAKFGVTHSCVWSVQQRRTWRHVT
jgi:hypothetical protein